MKILGLQVMSAKSFDRLKAQAQSDALAFQNYKGWYKTLSQQTNALIVEVSRLKALLPKRDEKGRYITKSKK